MIISMKKRTFFAAVLAVFAAVGGSGAAFSHAKHARTFLPNEGRTIVMDAGHGGKHQYHIAF